MIQRAKEFINNIISAAKYGELTKTYFTNFVSCISSIPTFSSILSYDTIKEMLGDDTITNCIQSKRQTILAKGWRLEPAEADVDSPEYEKYKQQADFVEFCLTDGLYQMSINSIIEEILTAGIIIPLSITEINYTQENTNFGFKTIFKNFKTRLIEQLNMQFEINYDDFGDIKSIKQNQVNIPLEKLLLFKYQGENVIINNFEKIYKYWYAKKIYEVFKNNYIELCSRIPTIAKGRIPEYGTVEYTALKTFIDNMSVGGRGMIPHDIEVEFPNFTEKNFATEIESAIKVINYKIRAILEKPMLLDQAGLTGSYSLGKNQLDDYYLNLQSTQLKLQNIINEAIYRLVIINYPNETRFPKFVINDLYEEDSAIKINKILTATDKGYITPKNPDDMNNTRKYLGIWKHKEYTSNIINELPLNNQEEIKKDIENENIESSKNKKIETNFFKKMQDDISKTISVKTMTMKDWKKPRFMSDSETTEIKKSMEAIENDKASDIILVVNKQIDSLITYDRIAKILKNFNTDLIASLDIPYFSEMQNKFYQITNNYYSNTKKQTKNQIKNKNLMDFVVTENASEHVKKVLKLSAYNNTEKITSQILQIFKDNLTSGLANGSTEKEIYFNTISQIENKGLKDSQVRTLLRTSSTDSFNMARQEVLTDVSYGFEFSAVLDEVTTQQCELLDGNVYKINDPFLDRIRPALHYNCRSILVPITIEEDFKSALNDIGGANKVNADTNKALTFIPSIFGGDKTNNARIK